MHSSGSGTDTDRRCPRLAPGWEERAVALNPAEGFLLSRIDGHTPWAVLREIGGLMPEEADLAIESWLGTGLVVLDDACAESRPAPEVHEPDPPKAKAAAKRAGPDLSCIDAALDLDVDLQRRILEFEAKLDEASYHEILGVGKGTEPRDIKRAYFQLSKQFHPDRYFRRNVGSHAPQGLDGEAPQGGVGLGGLVGLLGRADVVPVQPPEGGEDRSLFAIVVVVVVLGHSSSLISSRSAVRSFFMARRVRVFTVPRGMPVCSAISRCVRPL
jgi:hypothetical protein